MNWTEIVAIFPATAALLTAVATIVKIGQMAGTWEATIANQNTIINELKTEIKQLTVVIINQAIEKSRLDRIEKRVDEMAHGEGFVFPLTRQQ